MPDDSDLSNAAGKLTVITDLESNPVTVDHNPAHFDGFLHEIAEWSQRTMSSAISAGVLGGCEGMARRLPSRRATLFGVVFGVIGAEGGSEAS